MDGRMSWLAIFSYLFHFVQLIMLEFKALTFPCCYRCDVCATFTPMSHWLKIPIKVAWDRITSLSLFCSFLRCCASTEAISPPNRPERWRGFWKNPRKLQIIDLAILGNKVELIMTSQSLPAPAAALAPICESDLAPEPGQVLVAEVGGHSMRAFVMRRNAGNIQAFALMQAERTRCAGDLSPVSKTGVITS